MHFSRRKDLWPKLSAPVFAGKKCSTIFPTFSFFILWGSCLRCLRFVPMRFVLYLSLSWSLPWEADSNGLHQEVLSSPGYRLGSANAMLQSEKGKGHEGLQTQVSSLKSFPHWLGPSAKQSPLQASPLPALVPLGCGAVRDPKLYIVGCLIPCPHFKWPLYSTLFVLVGEYHLFSVGNLNFTLTIQKLK